MSKNYTFYGLRHKITKRPLGFNITSNTPSNESNDYQCYFEDKPFSHVYWLTTDRSLASKALNENPEWYNSSIENPRWSDRIHLYQDDYEIFEVN